jgi:hypothetical protein
MEMQLNEVLFGHANVNFGMSAVGLVNFIVERPRLLTPSIKAKVSSVIR